MECIGRTGMRSCLLRFRREKLWQMRGFYRVLLEILCEVEWVKSCFVVMEEMVKVGFTVDGCLGMRLIEKFVEQNMASEAEYLFREGVIKNKEGLCVLVEAMAEKGKPFVGLELIKFVNKSYLHGNGCVYTCLIRRCGKIGLIHDAEKIFSEINSYEMVLDMGVVYSAVIYVYTREEMKKREEMIWCEMGNATGIQTNREAYMYMMSMYRALGLIEELLRLFDQMKRNVFHVSIDVYIVVISALSKAGKLNQAREFLLEMRNGGIKPTNSVYSLMMEGYVGIGLTSHGLALIDEYKKLGLQVDEIIVTSVVQILSEAGYTLLG